MEYRVNFLFSLLSAAYPIFIQTFLWTAIYNASTEDVVYGYSYRQMIAYTFLAGLVSRIVRTGFEYEIMDDVKGSASSAVSPSSHSAISLTAWPVFLVTSCPGRS